MLNTHGEGELLLRNVLLNTHTDAPRLEYANWLTKNGEEERAEIIRTQICGAEEKHRSVDSGPYLMASALGKLMGFPSTPRGLWLAQFWLRRGFVRKIKLFHVLFLRVARSYFKNHPIESVDLVGKSPVVHHQLHEGSISLFYGWGIFPEGAEHTIPEALFNFLPDADLIVGGSEKYYRTKVSSLEAISVACVRYGRSEAGIDE